MTLIYILGTKEQTERERSTGSQFETKIRTFTEIEKLELTIEEANAIIAYTPYREQNLGMLTQRIHKWTSLKDRWEKIFNKPIIFYDSIIQTPKQPKKNILLLSDTLPEGDRKDVWKYLTK